MLTEIIKRTLRVPVDSKYSGQSPIITKQLDGALIKNGFKLSPSLFDAISKLHITEAKKISISILDSVKELIGNHVNHNVYFQYFPKNVPTTEEFWAECILDALKTPGVNEVISAQLSFGFINLLDLPKYGQYLHSYEDMVAVHEKFISNSKMEYKILHLGESLEKETENLFYSLAKSNVPLSESDRILFSELSVLCANSKSPDIIPLRENRAIINAARIRAKQPIIVDTVTDVLRLASHICGGDVTLAQNTKFKKLNRSTRKIMLTALADIAEHNPEKLSDVNNHKEEWKRLFERLHPYEYKKLDKATLVHKVALGEEKYPSVNSRIEKMLNDADFESAVNLYKNVPGIFYRNIDRLLRFDYQPEIVVDAIKNTVSNIPGRILLSLREHLSNRIDDNNLTKRIFNNTQGKTWVQDEDRDHLPVEMVEKIFNIIDAELTTRLPEIDNLIIDPNALQITLPLTNKNVEEGISLFPRGSRIPLDKKTDTLRFFMYWKQSSTTTDYDLSCIFLDDEFYSSGHVSYTNLSGTGYVHSGDITRAPNGASEFIDIKLNQIRYKYLLPQVYLYSGETFKEVEESFFGFMEREQHRKGLPFEPKTVKTKSSMRGVGRIACPLVFTKEENTWYAIWMHMYLGGRNAFNNVEGNRLSAQLLAKSIINRNYLTMDYIIGLYKNKKTNIVVLNDNTSLENYSSGVYLGLLKPEKISENIKSYTSTNLYELVDLFNNQ